MDLRGTDQHSYHTRIDAAELCFVILPLREVDIRAFPLGELYPHLGFAARQPLGVTTCCILALACGTLCGGI